MTDVQPTSSQRITNPNPVVPYGMVLLSTLGDLIFTLFHYHDGARD
jgi:hypothetical protein